MSGVIFTEPTYISNLVKMEAHKEWGFCRDTVSVTITAGADLTIGSVLGQVTATGEYTPRDPDATDGSEVAAAIVIANTSVPAATATDVLVIVRGDVVVAEEALVFDVSHDATQKAAAVAELLALGIQTRTQLYK